MKRGRNDLGNKPWVAIATVAGFVAVLIIAVAFYLGNPGVQHVSSDEEALGISTPFQSATTSAITSVSPSINELTTVAVPVTGVWVRVSYIGAYTGTYGADADRQNIENSGDRVFGIQNTEGNITATFTKEDGSTRHEMLVEIYDGGTVVKSGRNSSAYGEVSLSYHV
jgi:hypothetical protein